MKRKALTFAKGGLSESYPWSIHFDQVFAYCDETVCGHCVELKEGDKGFDRTAARYSKRWKCQRTVCAVNEGGSNSTAVCLDCILEASARLAEE